MKKLAGVLVALSSVAWAQSVPAPEIVDSLFTWQLNEQQTHYNVVCQANVTLHAQSGGAYTKLEIRRFLTTQWETVATGEITGTGDVYHEIGGTWTPAVGHNSTEHWWRLTVTNKQGHPIKSDDSTGIFIPEGE